MNKAGKFLLVVVGGIAIGSAAVTIPSVVYYNQRNYQDQKAKLQQAEANVKYDIMPSINKAQTLASNITKNEIIFSGYDKELFDIDLVDISTPVNTKLSLAPGKNTKTTIKTIQYFNANNTSGTLEFKFIVRSKRYADLSIVKNGTITGFLKANPVVPITKTAKKSADTIIPAVMAAYNTISQNPTLKPEQVNAINNYATEVANGLAKENLAVLQAVESSLPNSQFDTVSALYRAVALSLNDVLADILNKAIQNKAATNGIEQVKAYLNAEKMLSIKNTIADILISKATEIANVGQEIFNSLKVNETTKNIEVLDSFINGMSQFFNSEITTLANKIKQVQIASDSSQMEAIKQLKAFLPELKSAAVAKAHELLPQAANYEAIKAVLKPQYEALEASIQSNIALLINETKALASLIDALKLSPTIDTPVVTPEVNSDITTFVYDDGNKKTEIKYDNNAKKLIIPDTEVITEPMFKYAFEQLENLNKADVDHITLSCPETKVIPGTIDTKISISKLDLPKIEKVVNKNIFTGSHMFDNRLSRNLEDNKVVQNGILFKWNNPIGVMKDSTITQIVPFAINQTAYVTEIDLPNLENVDFSAFEHPNNDLRTIFPQINSKIVLNGILIKWPGATGQIEDSEVTKIASCAFIEDRNITSVSFPNVTEIGNAAFGGCSNLESISFPKVTTVAPNAFILTRKLKGQIILGDNLVKWTDANGDIQDNDVKMICDQAFSFNKNITSVSFPNVTYIGDDAFHGTEKLESISFPKVEKVGRGAFSSAGIETVALSNAKYIGDFAFSGMNNLKFISLPYVEELGESIFTNTPQLTDKVVINGTLVKWENASGVISDPSIKTIYTEAFANNQNITSVSFPNVTNIGDGAFKGTTSLTSVSFPNVTSIGKRAFEGATNLTSVSFPNVTYIGDNAFEGTSKLATISFPKATRISPDAFVNTDGLKGKVIINGTLVKWSDATGAISDENITSIASGVFKDNKEITSVSFPNVISLANEVFAGASKLTSVSLPNIENIGLHVFDNTDSLTGKVIINNILVKWDNAVGQIRDDSIKGIYANVFADNDKITSAIFPNVTRVWEYAFANASNLAYVELPKVKKLTHSIFDNNYGLRAIKMDGLLSVDHYTFHNLPSLETISLSSIKEIDERTFSDLKKLTFINMPNVIAIGAYAFKDDLNLLEVSFPNVIAIGPNAFLNNINLAKADFPKAKYIANNAFDSTPKLTNKPTVKEN
ncbi:leucine-rich repeat domain-containing protein [Mycoplasma sp. B6400]|uniref:leucine-rich repeat domain-containing protein n=1 Tax=Mycoplasma sp. B6400 TaxID=3401674 RepID=UPI003AAA546D